MKSQSVSLTKQLILIPSFVDQKNNDSKLAEWVYRYLKKNSNLKILKQYFSKKRFNVIATNTKSPLVLISGHLDTVQPQAGWKTDPLMPLEKNGKIYGLGASDMKSGLAIMLSLCTTKIIGKPVMFLFYGDEEYDFAGMKKFVSEYRKKINPKLIISLDGENLQIGNSCRGLIELTIKVSGKTGHAANPKAGINAILNSQKVIQSLNQWLAQYSSPELGKSTFNIAYFLGGTNQGTKNGKIVLAKEGNIIPDYCEYIVEIRSATDKLSAQKVSGFVEKESITNNLKVSQIKIRHDLKSWITPKKELIKVLKYCPRKQVISAKQSGYIDIQMLWEAFGKAPAFTFGPGEKGKAHKANEFVRIQKIKQAEVFLRKVLANC